MHNGPLYSKHIPLPLLLSPKCFNNSSILHPDWPKEAPQTQNATHKQGPGGERVLKDAYFHHCYHLQGHTETIYQETLHSKKPSQRPRRMF